MKGHLPRILFIVLGAWASIGHAANIGTAFTYQGTLENGSGPVTDTCDFRFGLWDDSAAGAQVGGSPVTVADVNVVAGAFDSAIDFGAGAIDGTARWLEIEVQCPGDAGFALLSPRIALTPAPHALALPGLYTQANANSPNIIGGHSANIIYNNVVGATIGGGGDAFSYHTITDMYGTIAGGRNNQAGDDAADSISAMHAAVCGGISNIASGTSSFVGGGDSNEASGGRSAVGGGVANTASRFYSTVPGGGNNWAGGDYSFAAGHRAKVRNSDSASPYYSGDTTGDEGTFIWADSTNADFVSTGPNQFLVRAGGGVGIGTNNPTDPLTVAGVIHSTTGGLKLPDGTIIDAASDFGDITAVTAGTGLTGGGTSGSVTLNVAYAGNGAANSSARSDHYHSSLAASDGSPSNAVNVDAAGNVAIGTPTPSATLDVAGSLEVDGNTLFVDSASNRVGIGTTAPNSTLEVVGSLRADTNTFFVDATNDRVGVGTLSPSATLDVVGSLEVDGDTLYVNSTSDRVGIGTTGPTQALHVVGNACVTGTVSTCSDARYKTDVAQIDDALSVISRLRGVHFNWRSDEFPERRFANEPQIGFIAQEIAEVVPEVVTRDDEGYYWVDYGRLTPVIVEAIKTQERVLEEQKQLIMDKDCRVDELQRQNVELEARLIRVEAMLKASLEKGRDR